MPGVSFDRPVETQALIDLLKLTRDHYREDYKTTIDVLTDRHDWPVMNQWFRPDNVEMWPDGTMYKDVVFFDREGNATSRHVRPYTRDEVSISDAIGTITIPLRRLTDNWAIEKTEDLINSGPSRIFKIDSARKLQMQIGIARHLTERAFKAPASSTDDLNPYGIPYYLPPITTTQAAVDTQGHQGYTITYEDGTTTTTCAGIDASDSDYNLWRSYNARWYHDDILNDFDDEDVQRIIRMLRHLRFRAPLNADAWRNGEYDFRQAYTSEDLLDAMEKKARQNNDSLQADLGKFSGQVVIKGVPLEWNEVIDTWTNSDGDASHTLLVVNHNYFKPVVLEGRLFAESEPKDGGIEYHDLIVTFTDLCYNYLCTNRRMAGGRIDVEPMT